MKQEFFHTIQWNLKTISENYSNMFLYKLHYLPAYGAFVSFDDFLTCQWEFYFDQTRCYLVTIQTFEINHSLNEFHSEIKFEIVCKQTFMFKFLCRNSIENYCSINLCKRSILSRVESSINSIKYFISFSWFSSGQLIGSQPLKDDKRKLMRLERLSTNLLRSSSIRLTFPFVYIFRPTLSTSWVSEWKIVIKGRRHKQLQRNGSPAT